jgi:TnpA family transposase
MFSTACSTMSPTCGSRNTTPTLPALPITSLRSCHLLGFRFAPRIRDLADKRLYVPGKERDQPTLAPLIGGKLNLKLVRTQWDEILRLAASIRHGTVTASLIIRKLASYPRQNSLHTALREVGRIERSLFMLEWMKNPELRRRVQVGLNKE